jgi:hypothetical protein
MPPFPEKSEYHYQPKKDDSIGSDLSPAKSRQILAKVISDRISFLQKSIEAINRQIEERQRLKETLNSDIDEKLCETKNVLYELEYLGIKNGRQISLEELLASLHKEKRHQQLSHWQDTVMLEKELRNLEKEILSAVRDWWMVRNAMK